MSVHFLVLLAVIALLAVLAVMGIVLLVLWLVRHSSNTPGVPAPREPHSEP